MYVDPFEFCYCFQYSPRFSYYYNLFFSFPFYLPVLAAAPDTSPIFFILSRVLNILYTGSYILSLNFIYSLYLLNTYCSYCMFVLVSTVIAFYLHCNRSNPLSFVCFSYACYSYFINTTIFFYVKLPVLAAAPDSLPNTFFHFQQSFHIVYYSLQILF